MELSLYEFDNFCKSMNYKSYCAKNGISSFVGDAFCIGNNRNTVILFKANGECLRVHDVEYVVVSQQSNCSIIQFVCNHFLAEGGRIKCCHKTYEVIAR